MGAVVMVALAFPQDRELLLHVSIDEWEEGEWWKEDLGDEGGDD